MVFSLPLDPAAPSSLTKRVFVTSMLCLALGLSGCAKRNDVGERSGEATEPPTGLPSYADAVASVQMKRSELLVEYRSARGTEQRRGVIDRARRELVSGIFGELMPHWLGTAWDFNGITETPGEGEIACGYFVSTVLRDAGLSVERYKLAQQASQNIIRSLTDREHMKTFHGGKYDDFVSGMAEFGDGLYIIGLDRHVGFIVQWGGEAFFVHSDGGAHRCVVREKIAEAATLQRSSYRIVGKISADDALVGRWLSGEQIATVLPK